MKLYKKGFTIFLILCICFANFNFTFAAENVIVVATQKQLNQALKTDNSTTIKIKTEKRAAFKIPKSAKSTNRKLIIEAPNANIFNKATFKTITFQGETVKSFTENGINNNIIINSSDINLILGNNASVKKITTKGEEAAIIVKKNALVKEIKTNKKNSSIVLTVHGEVGNINVSSKKSNLILKGNADNVPVTVKAEGVQITASLAVNLELKEDAKITLNKGAEKSEINIEDGVTPELLNKTEKEIVLKTPDKTETITPITSQTPKPSEMPKASETPKPSETQKPSEIPQTSTKPNSTTGGGSTALSTPSQTPNVSETPKPSETSKPELSIVGIYPSFGKVRVELNQSVKLSKDNFYISCPAGSDMTILRIETPLGENENRIYDLITAYYIDNTYILTITLPDGKTIEKEFVVNSATPNITEAYAERVDETNAEVFITSEQNGKAYYMIVKDETNRAAVNTKPATAQDIKQNGTLAILQAGLNKIKISNLEPNTAYQFYYIVCDESEENISDILEVVNIDKGSLIVNDITIEECEAINTHQFIVRFNKPTPKKLEISAFDAKCPAGSLTLGSVTTEDNQTYTVALKENYYYYPKNTYRVTVTFPDSSVATGSFYAETYPDIKSITVIRTSETKATVSFTSDKEGFVYYGTATSYDEKPLDVDLVIENGTKVSISAGKNEFEIEVPKEHNQFYMVAIDKKGNKQTFVSGSQNNIVTK